MRSSTSSHIPLTKMSSSSPPRHSLADEEEEEEEDETLPSQALDEHGTLLSHPLSPTTSRRRLAGALWQIISFTLIGLLIALASGAFAYSLRGRIRNDDNDFLHVPLPGMRDPSLLKYFGGMGPFIGGEYVSPGDGCKVSQVHMIARHGERYPTLSMGLQIATFARNVSLQGGFSGSLRFLNGWDLESDGWLYAPGDQLEQETLTGPAAGSLTLFLMGEEFRGRYTDIWNFETMGNLSQTGGLKVWASDSERVIHSAKYFSTAFFGVGTNVSVQLIPETRARWGNSLTTTYMSV